jgi:hypothetical protein
MNISECADAILALINSQPRTPRKEEIEDVLNKLGMAATEAAPDFTVDFPGTLEVMPITAAAAQHIKAGDMVFLSQEGVFKWSSPNNWEDWRPRGSDLTQAEFEAAVDHICKIETAGLVLESSNEIVQFRPAGMCPGSTDGSHYWCRSDKKDVFRCACGETRSAASLVGK